MGPLLTEYMRRVVNVTEAMDNLNVGAVLATNQLAALNEVLTGDKPGSSPHRTYIIQEEP